MECFANANSLKVLGPTTLRGKNEHIVHGFACLAHGTFHDSKKVSINSLGNVPQLEQNVHLTKERIS